MRLSVLDQISDPGEPGKPNDDALAHDTAFAAVFDGATGLADAPILPGEPSDAAWLAHFAAARFVESARAPIGDLVAGCCQSARDLVTSVVPLDSLPAWAWPSSSFQMARLVDGELEISGLGDSVCYVVSPDGHVTRHSAVPEQRGAEIRSAREARERAGRVDGPLIRQGSVLDGLRAARSRQNGGGGIWLLGLVPLAADHVRTVRMAIEPGTQILIATDGFTALSEAYDRYEPAALLRAAFEHGLPFLIDELRHLERVEDPRAQRWPRFKRSDDATAILAKITD